jgi:hypothetical protein
LVRVTRFPKVSTTVDRSSASMRVCPSTGPATHLSPHLTGRRTFQEVPPRVGRECRRPRSLLMPS